MFSLSMLLLSSLGNVWNILYLLTSPNNSELGTALIPVLQMRKQKHNRVNLPKVRESAQVLELG